MKMTSKKPKAELVALCKLEFYRKQKHWRYSPQDRKGKDSKGRRKSTNAKLNQTYSIARAPEKQEPSVPEIQETEKGDILDEAFVDTETGTESDEPLQREDQDLNAVGNVADKPSSQLDPLDSPCSPKWSIQRWAERRRLWSPEPTPTLDPVCPTHDPTYPTICPTYASTCPALNSICPTHDPTFPQQTSPREDANCPIFDNNYNKIQDVYYSSHFLNLHHKGPDYDANYPTQSYYDTKHVQEQFDPKFGFLTLVYYNSNMYHREFDVLQSGTVFVDEGKVGDWQVNEWDKCAGEGAVWCDADWLEEAAAVGAGGEDAVDGDWQLLDLSDVSRCDSLQSVASSEFLRGAVLAPHSTQIDLLVGPEPAAAGPDPAVAGPDPAVAGPDPTAVGLAPAQLPAAALAAAVAAHSAALSALLAEAQRRQQIPPQPLPELSNFDDVPVRDPGPAAPRCDRVLAGSRPAPALRGHTGHTGHTGLAGHTELAGQTGSGRGRGRTQVGIRMGRPYRL